MLKRIDEVLREQIERMRRQEEEERETRRKVMKEAVALVEKVMREKGWEPESAIVEAIDAQKWSETIWRVTVTITPRGFKSAELRPWALITVEADVSERKVMVKESQVVDAINYATNPKYWVPASEKEEAAEEEASSKPKLPPVPTLEELCERLKEARDGKGRIKTEDIYAALLALTKALWDLVDATWNRA